MRNLTLVCAGLAVMGGVISVHLWNELHAERELTAQLQARMEEMRAGSSFPGDAPQFAGPQERSGIAAASAPVPQAAVVTAEAGAENRAAAALTRSLLDQRELLKDPEYRKAQLQQTRLTIRQNYPGLVEELGLSTEEADRLFNLLAENQLDMNQLSVIIGADGAPDPAEMEALNRRRQELQQQHDQQLQAMLGGRYGQWQEYQQTRPSRMQVVQLSRTLESSGAPLSTEQSRSLVNIYIAEQERQREDSRRMQTATMGGRLDQARMMEEQANLLVESNRRVIDGARAHLNSRQLEALQATLDQRESMMRLSSRRMQLQQQQGDSPANTGVVIQAMPLPTNP